MTPGKNSRLTIFFSSKILEVKNVYIMSLVPDRASTQIDTPKNSVSTSSSSEEEVSLFYSLLLLL